MKFRNFVFLVVLLVMIMLISGVTVASAQAIDSSGLPPYDPNAFLNIIGQVMLVVLTALGGYAGSPITVWVVAVLKRIVPITWTFLDAKSLTTLVSLGLMGLLAAAVSLGYEAQFRQGVSIITAVLAVLAGSQQNLTQSAQTYNKALAVNAPFTSYQRTPNEKTDAAVAAIQKAA